MREAGGSCLASREAGHAYRTWEWGVPGSKLVSPFECGDGQARLRVDLPQALCDGEKRTEDCGSLLWLQQDSEGRRSRARTGGEECPLDPPVPPPSLGPVPFSQIPTPICQVELFPGPGILGLSPYWPFTMVWHYGWDGRVHGNGETGSVLCGQDWRRGMERQRHQALMGT